MREKLFLITSFALLVGSADHALFVRPSIAESLPSASNERTFTASIQSTSKHAVAPIRRVLVQLQREKEEKEKKEERVPVVTHYRQKTKSSKFKVQRSRISNNTRNLAPSTRNYSPIHSAIDKPDIKIKHRLAADAVLKLFPEQCQNKLRNFYVRYSNMEGRGLGGKSTIILNGNVPIAEFIALFIHEFGHLFDLGCVTGSSFARNSHYKDGTDIMKIDDPSVRFYQISWKTDSSQKAGSRDADFVSGYASWDMFEDFSESFTYYVLHRSEFAKRAQQNSALAAKYAWFQEHLPDLPVLAISNHRWNGTIPWDITRLSYTWIGSDQFAQQ